MHQVFDAARVLTLYETFEILYFVVIIVKKVLNVSSAYKIMSKYVRDFKREKYVHSNVLK